MMKLEEKERLDRNWKYAKKLWNEKKKEFGLEKWNLKMSGMSQKVGICNYNLQVITLSSVFLRGSNCNFSKVKKALMHELAHAITPGHQHNVVWKNVCEKIGGDTRLAATINNPGMSWVMHCQKCKWRLEFPSKPYVTNKVCSTCNIRPLVRYIK